jgi:hypothetical protein
MKKSEKAYPVKSGKAGAKHLAGLVRKVTRVGKRSLSIVIPAEIVDELKIKERQKMVFKINRKRILISDWK